MSEIKKEQMSYFDTIAASKHCFPLLHRENRNHIKKIRKLLKLLRILNGSRVLEVGVGSGIHAKFIMDRYNIDYVGVDISRGLLKEAQKKFREDAKPSFVVCDAERLPFGQESFDAVFCSGVLHHFPNPDIGIKEMATVLKRRCFLAVMEPNWLFPANLYSAFTSPLEKAEVLDETKQA